MRKFLKMGLVLLTLAACNLAGSPITPVPSDSPDTTGGKPQVIITDVQPSTSVAVNQTVLVNVTVTDTVGVTHIQMTANGRVVKTVSSLSARGDTNRTVLMDFTPTSIGTYDLQVVASRADGTRSDPAGTQIAAGTPITPTTTGSGGLPPTADPRLDPNDPTCRAYVGSPLNLRTGPGTNYQRILTIPADSVVPLTGRTSDNTWWQTRISVNTGWISAEFAQQYGNCALLHVMTPPPTPTTATITPTFSPASATPTLRPATATPTPGIPDLVVANIVPQTIALTLSGGAASQLFSVTVTNTGTGPTGQFQVRGVVQPGGQTTDLTSASLNPGESITLSVPTTFTAAGNYTLTVTVDSGSTVAEVSEVNNIGTAQITVSG